MSTVSDPANSAKPGSLLQNLRHDIPASIVVFLVALPLSLGIAVASGAPLMAGVIAAVAGGVVAGGIGGSPLLVSGPAAGLTVVVAGLIADLGWPMMCLMTICAGALQILFGLVRVARAALAVAPVVVHAMLAGIGVTICLQQIHVLLGGASRSSTWQNIKALPKGILNQDPHDVIIGGLVIAIMVLWSKLPPKVRFIPGPLVAIVVATAIATIATGLHVDRISVPGSFFDAIALPSLPRTSPGGAAWVQELSAIVVGVLTIALIASVESLLSAVGVDKLHSGPRSNFDRELIGQGSANVLSGLLGGLPVTGVIVRSSTNVAAGARTRLSGVMHGVWILVFASLFASVVNLIPKAALAGLLVVIGVQLVKLAHIKIAWRTGNFAVYIITIVCVVLLNLLEGVVIGLAVAIIILLIQVIRAPIEVKPYGRQESSQWRVDIDGTLSFLLLPRLTTALSTLPPGSDVTLMLNADYIDHSISEAISDWRRAHEATGGMVVIVETSHARLHAAHTNRPKRHFTPRAIGLVPWRAWRPNGRDDAGASILDGIAEYHRSGVGALHPHISELTNSQNPSAVFLTCADSRILPNVITASGPGDLYTVRNVGNLVPIDPAEQSVDAALDFGINQLGVSSVVVCGHSCCGAMTALLEDTTEQAATPMGRWLEHAHDSLVAYQDGHPARVSAESSGFNEVDQLGIVNVSIQVERLTRHPTLAGAVDSGVLRVVGIFFDISTARVYEVHPSGIVDPALRTSHALG